MQMLEERRILQSHQKERRTYIRQTLGNPLVYRRDSGNVMGFVVLGTGGREMLGMRGGSLKVLRTFRVFRPHPIAKQAPGAAHDRGLAPGLDPLSGWVAVVVLFRFSIFAILNEIEIGTELLINLGIEIETENGSRDLSPCRRCRLWRPARAVRFGEARALSGSGGDVADPHA
jgi:hypothetical protein